MKKRHLAIFMLVFVGLWSTPEVQAQDPEFTQYYAIPLYTNPAFAGTAYCNQGRGGGRAVVNYRNQWPSLPGTFVTTAASFDQHFNKLGGGVGLLVMDDRAGEGLLTSTSVSVIYSYQFTVNNNFAIRFGVEGQYGQRSIDWQRLRFEDQISPTQGFVNPTAEPYASGQSKFCKLCSRLVGLYEVILRRICGTQHN